MTNEEFQRWLAGVEQLTAAQRERLQQVAQEQGDEAASRAAIELRFDARRRCPRCGAGGAVRRGCAHRLRRYACRRTFHALTGTPLAGLRHRGRWRACGRALVARESVRKAAERCGVAPSTACRWRHRCVAQAGEPGGPLAGLVEADETCFRHSRKGEWSLDRKPRQRGGPARLAACRGSRCRCWWPRPAGAGRRAWCWRRPARRTCRRRWSRCGRPTPCW